MKFLIEYIEDFKRDSDPAKNALADELEETRQTFDLFLGVNPMDGFDTFVERYNWLGQADNKARYNITQNLARNLVGTLMQDFLVNLLIARTEPFPSLRVVTEVRITFGRYPLWHEGKVRYASPAEKSDIAVGYLHREEEIIDPEEDWPRPAVTRLPSDTRVIPLVTINSKVRVSQSEFFDWQGREQLMTKGNPHCLSVQVALRKEMDLDIVDAAQAVDKFFLLGSGGEGRVIPDQEELNRLVEQIDEHLAERMG